MPCTLRALGARYSETVVLYQRDFAMSDDEGRTTAYSGTYTVLFSNGDGAEESRQLDIAEDTLLDTLPALPAP